MPQADQSIVFIDGQNFYLSARSAFGVKFPDFDIVKLGHHLSQEVSGKDADEIHFYTGMPLQKYSPRWFDFWTSKLRCAEEAGVHVTTRPLRYHLETDSTAPNGVRILSTREKGIDLCLALDALSVARRHNCKNIVIASRDQDFVEVVDKIKLMCDFEQRDIDLWSAYPHSDATPDHIRGIPGTRDLQITHEAYLELRDFTDYRNHDRAPKTSPSFSL